MIPESIGTYETFEPMTMTPGGPVVERIEKLETQIGEIHAMVTEMRATVLSVAQEVKPSIDALMDNALFKMLIGGRK